MRNAKRKKDPPAGKLDPTLCPQKMERGIDVFFESGVGTDGARTRNFRLDRAVLWPIELQSQENEVYSLQFLFFLFIRTIDFRRVVTETRMIYYIIF